MNILVLDVGTSGMKGVLMDNKGEKLVSTCRKYSVTFMQDGRVEQNPFDWKKAMLGILKEIVAKAETMKVSVDAISLTSQRSSVVAVDHNMNPWGNAIMWQDKRTKDICRELEKENDLIFQRCGAKVNPLFSGSKMTWIRENCPEIYEKTYKFLVIPDYLIYILTGKLCTDYTYGSRSLLMNIHKCEWDKEQLRMFRVDEEKLCDLVKPGSICGETTFEIEKETGCKKGIPVITAGGDQQCGAIGQGVVKEGCLSVTVGTGGFLVTAVNKIPEDLKSDVICNIHAVKESYILESNIITCCSALDWFKREFYENWSYEEMNAEAEKSPAGANGCLCVPYFQGRSTPDWNNDAKGLFANITLGTRKRDILRSLLESIAYEIDNGIWIMNGYKNITEINVNGGLTNSAVFNEIQCNVYGRKILKRGDSDSTVRGAYMVAAVTLGLYDTVEDAFEALDKDHEIKEYIPKDHTVRKYEACRQKMNEIYEQVYR